LSLRVLIVAHGHPELSAGGAEFAAYMLFRRLRREPGITAHFLAWAEAGAHPGSAGHCASFRNRRDETLIFAKKFDNFLFRQLSKSAVAAFSCLLARIDPDVVHFHHYTNIGLDLIARVRDYKPAIRIVVTLHEYMAICHHHGVMVKTHGAALCAAAEDRACAACFPEISAADFARRRQHIQSHFARCDLLISPSEFLRQRYMEWGVPAWQIVVIENGIDPVRPPPPRPRAAGERRAVFAFFGQIHPFKGLLELLSAFARLARFPAAATNGIRLVIHGAYLELNHPAYVRAFNELLAETSARVRFRGPYARRDLHRLMAAVDWVVVPSIWWENSPLVIAEALAHRRPVVCCDIGGMAEKVRPGKDGFHFPAGNPLELAKLLARLSADDAVWDALQQTMRRPATVDESVLRHLEVYRDRSFAFAR
jgi:glycosyltransferase involved in cell wall biosynthesis